MRERGENHCWFYVRSLTRSLVRDGKAGRGRRGRQKGNTAENNNSNNSNDSNDSNDSNNTTTTANNTTTRATAEKRQQKNTDCQRIGRMVTETAFTETLVKMRSEWLRASGGSFRHGSSVLFLVRRPEGCVEQTFCDGCREMNQKRNCLHTEQNCNNRVQSLKGLALLRHSKVRRNQARDSRSVRRLDSVFWLDVNRQLCFSVCPLAKRRSARNAQTSKLAPVRFSARHDAIVLMRRSNAQCLCQRRRWKHLVRRLIRER